jgi:hypothetical protein
MFDPGQRRKDEGSMTTNFFMVGLKTLATVAWSAVLVVSTATPAEAVAASYQSGQHAVCTAPWDYNGGQCGSYTFNYVQWMKIEMTGCSTGGCTSNINYTYVEYVYPTGRKICTPIGYCPNLTAGNNLYLIGTCAC